MVFGTSNFWSVCRYGFFSFLTFSGRLLAVVSISSFDMIKYWKNFRIHSFTSRTWISKTSYLGSLQKKHSSEIRKFLSWYNIHNREKRSTWKFKIISYEGFPQIFFLKLEIPISKVLHIFFLYLRRSDWVSKNNIEKNISQHFSRSKNHLKTIISFYT